MTSLKQLKRTQNLLGFHNNDFIFSLGFPGKLSSTGKKYMYTTKIRSATKKRLNDGLLRGSCWDGYRPITFTKTLPIDFTKAFKYN